MGFNYNQTTTYNGHFNLGISTNKPIAAFNVSKIFR